MPSGRSDGKIQIDPEDVQGKEVFVTVRPAEYLSAEGSMVRRNEVPYDGYVALAPNADEAKEESTGVEEDPGETEDAEDPLPF